MAIFAAMVQLQGNLCFICNGRPNTTGGPIECLRVDHDHKTGKVRKLLCNRCNALVDCLENNRPFKCEPLIRQRLDEYVEMHAEELVFA